MPKFYFDIDDGQSAAFDVEGCEMKDRAAARSEAVVALLSIARDEPDIYDKALRATVRDERDNIIFEAKLSLAGKWTD